MIQFSVNKQMKVKILIASMCLCILCALLFSLYSVFVLVEKGGDQTNTLLRDPNIVSRKGTVNVSSKQDSNSNKTPLEGRRELTQLFHHKNLDNRSAMNKLTSFERMNSIDIRMTNQEEERYNKIISEPLEQKLKRISQKLKHSEQIIITTCTSGFKAFLYNWMCSIENIPKEETSDVRLLDHVLVYTVDEYLAQELITKRNFSNVYLDKQMFKKENDINGKSRTDKSINEDDKIMANSRMVLNFDTLAYQRLIMYRTNFIKQVLTRYNIRVLLADNDSVWLHNPFNHLLSGAYSTDMIAQDDKRTEDKEHLTCGGFLYLNNTDAMKKTWNIIAKSYEELITNAEVPKYDNEQYMLQSMVGKSYNVSYLPLHLFPNGNVYFNQIMKQKNATLLRDVMVVHNNFIVGMTRKLFRFRKFRYHLWQVNEKDNFKCMPRREISSILSETQ